MIKRINIFLLWLLALALPLQGVAAVMQVGCASSLLHPAPMSAPAMPASMSMQHTGMDMNSMHAGMHMMDADHMQHMPHASHSDSGKTSPASSASCSSCSVCTTGAVLPLALAAPATLPLPAERPAAQTYQGFVGYTPENPERPPAFSL